jgi:hypothetical protein
MTKGFSISADSINKVEIRRLTLHERHFTLGRCFSKGDNMKKGKWARIKDEYLNIGKLTRTCKLDLIGNETLRENIADMYNDPQIEDKMLGSIINAIFTEKKPYFWFTHKILETVFKEDINVDQKWVGGNNYRKFIHKWLANDMFEVIISNRGTRCAAVWGLKNENFVEAFKELYPDVNWDKRLENVKAEWSAEGGGTKSTKKSLHANASQVLHANTTKSLHSQVVENEASKVTVSEVKTESCEEFNLNNGFTRKRPEILTRKHHEKFTHDFEVDLDEYEDDLNEVDNEVENEDEIYIKKKGIEFSSSVLNPVMDSKVVSIVTTPVESVVANSDQPSDRPLDLTGQDGVSRKH